MEVVDGLGPVDRQELLDLVAYRLLGLDKRLIVCWNRWHVEPIREITRDRRREDEVSVGDALHQCRGPEPVRTVIREVRFTGREETGNRRLEVVVDPETAHRVV